MLALSFFSVTAAGLLLFPRAVTADHKYTPAELCSQGCYEAISGLTFKDESATDTYVGMRCHSTLSVTSIYACYASYCSEYPLAESFGYLNEYCTEYGVAPLSMSYDDGMEYIKEHYGSVSNVTVIDPRLVLATTVVNTTIIPVKEYVELGSQTLVSLLLHAFAAWC